MIPKVSDKELCRFSELRSGGIPLDAEVLREMEAPCRGLVVCQSGDVFDHEDGLLMRQIGGEIESSAFDLFYGGTGYTICLRIVVNLPNFALASFGLELPWGSSNVSMLEDPIETGAKFEHYWFPDKDPSAFERSTVINHYANVQRMLRRGKTIEGLLLAVDVEPIPDEYSQGSSLPAFVIGTDQFDKPYRVGVSLWVNRRNRLSQKSKQKSSRKPLLECPDPGYGHTELPSDEIAVHKRGAKHAR